MVLLRALPIALLAVLTASPAVAATLREVVEKAVRSNPAVEAVLANKRATEYELRQSEGRRLPRIDVDADYGAERIDRPGGFTSDVNNRWRARREAGITLTQVVFDGWERMNDIYRNTARVNAAALRTLARSEIVALDAIEAYIDVRRHQGVIRLAQESLQVHRRILARVREQERAGKVAQSDVTQVEERVASTEVAIERIRQSLFEAEAKFNRVVGERPRNLQAAGYPAGVPASRREAVDAGLKRSPLVAAAGADVDVARLAFEQTKSARFPTVAVEVGGLTGADLAGTPGRDNEVRAQLVLRWNLFDGFITRHRQLEFAERLAQASAERDERARLVQEEIERALAAYYAGGLRLAPLRKQLGHSRNVVAAYETEYGLAKRSLLELLNAENARLNTAMDLANSEALHVFSAYRILGAMGGILNVLGISPPASAEVGGYR
ncbi:MAG: TolC family protein [Hyphomicrobiaceae bacterium]|nr:TolC family protein [Hyphomicrobiaceae bacterium]